MAPFIFAWNILKLIQKTAQEDHSTWNSSVQYTLPNPDVHIVRSKKWYALTLSTSSTWQCMGKLRIHFMMETLCPWSSVYVISCGQSVRFAFSLILDKLKHNVLDSMRGHPYTMHFSHKGPRGKINVDILYNPLLTLEYTKID